VIIGPPGLGGDGALDPCHRLAGALGLAEDNAQLMICVGMPGSGGEDAPVGRLGFFKTAGALILGGFAERRGESPAIGGGDICHGRDCKACGAGIC